MNVELRECLADWESASSIIRNLGLVIAAVAGLLLAYWRSKADHPSGQRDDIQTVLRKLKSRSDPALQLEKKHKFYIYLRAPQLSRSALRSSKFAHAHFVGADLSHAYAECSDLSYSRLEHCDLSDGRFTASNFFLAGISHSNLSGSNFQAVNFHRVNMHFVDLSTSNLKYATLTRASLSALDFRGASLHMADLSGARIEPGRRLSPDGEIDDKEVFCVLTQAQLDEAAANSSNPPEIHSGTFDAETGKKLVWNNERGRQNWERLQEQKQG